VRWFGIDIVMKAFKERYCIGSNAMLMPMIKNPKRRRKSCMPKTKMEQLPGGEKEKIRPNIEDLHMLISEMDDRIEQIRENCRPETCMDDILTERKAFDATLATLRVNTEEAMRGLGAGNFGG
jgi:hypothetical protein